ncbi:MAG: phage terminase large subunit [Phycisphaerae bacterium]|nr:phage terminase large subunit [Phycisphaerae bacterium]
MTPTQHLQLNRLTERVRTEQRAVARRSLRAFGHLYLPHHLEKPASKMHEELFSLLEALPGQPGARLALAAPRGSAKSTLVGLVFVLWSICHKLNRYIVLISDTADKASDFLAHVKHELVHNDLLAQNYPEVCEPQRMAPRPPRWKASEIITHNDVKITALGVGQNIRGRRHVESRPDLIILDDVENRENTGTPDGRKKLSEWFNKSILKAGTKQTQVIVIGTIPHYDSLLAGLTDPMKSPVWTGRTYRSVLRWSEAQDLWERWSAVLHRRADLNGRTGAEAARDFFDAHRDAMLVGTEVLWPEMEDYYSLMLMRESEGPAAFDSEKQNEPVNPEDCLFLEEDFCYWDDRWETEAALIASLDRKLTFVGACDPSLGGRNQHADDSAIVTLLRDMQSGTLYVLDADISRRKPDRIIEDVLAYQRLRKYARFGFEANHFQAFLADELQRRSKEAGLYLPIEQITHSTDKVGRVQSLQPLIRSGALQFSRRHKVLLEQIRLFPKAAHDDGPDALEMAVETARKAGRSRWRAEDLKMLTELAKKHSSYHMWAELY